MVETEDFIILSDSEMDFAREVYVNRRVLIVHLLPVADRHRPGRRALLRV